MKSPSTTSLRKQTPIDKKAMPYMTTNKSNFTYMKSKLIITLFVLFSLNITWSQTIVSENVGTPTATTTIASNTFQNAGVLNYSNGSQTNSADIRNTSASTNYSGASGGGNVYFTATSGSYGFSIEGINAANYNSLALQYGYRKEAASSLASFSVDYWNGTAWNTLANTATALFNEVATATSTWYLAKILSLPTDAQINGLKIRFVKTGTVAIRIDDIKLIGVETLPTITNASVSTITSNSATFGGAVTATGGSSITATGSVYSISSVNTNPIVGGAGVTAIATSNPNSGIGSFTNTSGTVLSPNVQYSYNAYATKSSGTRGYGTVTTFYTLAVTPTAPTVAVLSASKINVTIGNDSNSSSTTYAILETNSGDYVQSDGTLSTTALFQTKAVWATKSVIGLAATTSYTFQIVAKNGAGIVTAAGPTASGTTLTIPAIVISGSLTALTTTYGAASSFTSFSVSGTNLNDSIVITAPVGFEISKTTGGLSGYANSQTLLPTTGAVSTTTIYVRISATTGYGTYSGNVTLASANDGITVTTPMAISTVSKLMVTITGISAVSKVYDGNTTASLSGTAVANGILISDSSTVTLNTTSVTANFIDSTISTSKSVTIAGYTLNGTAAANYNVTQPSGLVAAITANTSSDVVFNNSSSTSSNTNIDYTLYQGTTLTSTSTGINGSIGVMGFYLRDGGVSSNDADNLDTELTAITFNITNAANIRSARLFVGNSPRGVPVAVNGASTITFTGLTNIIASDNSQLAINLRVTFNSTVTDNQQIQFTITSVTAKDSGSSFYSFNGSGASSSVAGDINRIEVTAYQLAFIQQPTTSYAQANMTPFPSLEATDYFGNRDLDFSAGVTLTSTGTLGSGSLIVNATNGVVAFNSVNHTIAGTGLILTATATGLASATSNTFDINALIAPTFNAVAPICYGGTAPNLPTTSLNGISGSWSPDVSNTATTTYTFAPDAGQNATGAALLLTVTPMVTPTFNAIPPIPSGTMVSALPTISTNAVIGTWSPAIENTTTTTYTFTPSAGTCATPTTLSLVVIPPASGSTTTVINSVHKIVYKIPTSTSLTTTIPSTTTADQVVEQVAYFDGLGRPIQQKILKQSNSGHDIITPTEYDAFSRQPKQYLPYVNSATSPDYEPNAVNDVAVYYTNLGANFESTAYPYSQKTFENSPLNRVIKVAAPGDDWRTTTGNDHTVKIDYQTNAASEVHMFNASTTTSTYVSVSALLDLGSYPANELTKTITKNENWKPADGTNNTTEQFQDKEGRIVLKRTYGTSMVNGSASYESHDTYYVFDQFSNLSFVITPKVDVTTTPSQAVLDDLCYQYRYDYRNRLIEKKLPGKDWEYVVYDKLDRVVATGPSPSPFTDATSSTNKGWLITKYDAYNRVITTGWMLSNAITSTDRSSLQSTLNMATTFNETKTGTSYSNVAWPSSGYEPLTLNYYDNYNTNLTFTQPMTYASDGYNNTTALPIGLPTISWVRVPEATAANSAEISYIIYDKKGRPLTTFSNNYLGGYTTVTKQMQIMTGRVNVSVLKHKRSSSATDVEITTTNAFTYSDQDRLTKATHQIGSGTLQLMSKNEYSELGQLISKRVGSQNPSDVSTGLQKIDYRYNARGWLKEINDITDLKVSTENDLFAFKLNYNTVDDPNSTQQYNGNIAEIEWVTASNNTKKQYRYNYDELNRLTSAVYSTPVTGVVSSPSNSFGENAQYDKNGNITHLDRYTDGSTPTNQIDELTYTYAANSNKLLSVTDAQPNTAGFNDGNTVGDDYSYDTYGNLTQDKNKGIINTSNPTQSAIAYNHLNLPTKILFGNSGTIEYLYNAVGKKLQKKVTQGGTVTTTDYLDGFQYTNTALQFFETAEGYVKPDGTYVFQYKDHLGNVRVSYYSNNGTATIIDENNYYPFGLRQIDNTITSTVNKNQYNGKEYQDELGLNITAMDYRQYDNAIGRFNVIDALSEQAYSNSPYTFAGNNPVLYGDPSGLKMVAPEPMENNIIQGSCLALFGGGMNGLQVRNALEQQMWGPNFWMLGDGGGGGGSDAPTKAEIAAIFASVGLNVTTNSNGDIGYWSKVKGEEPDGLPISYDIPNNPLDAVIVYNTWKNVWVPINSGVVNFMSGFTGADNSNFTSGSALLGYGGLEASKTEAIIRGLAKGQTFAEMRYTAKTLQGFAKFGRGLGYLTTAVSVVEDYQNDNLGAGTVFKAGIGILCTINPAFGLGYAIFDLSYGAITGTTFTDSVAAGIDNSLK